MVQIKYKRVYGVETLHPRRILGGDTCYHVCVYVIHMWHDLCICDMSHSHVSWLIHTWHVLSCVCQRLIHIWHVLSCACQWPIHMWHLLSCVCQRLIHMWHVLPCVCQRLIHIHDTCYQVCVKSRACNIRLCCTTRHPVCVHMFIPKLYLRYG